VITWCKGEIIKMNSDKPIYPWEAKDVELELPPRGGSSAQPVVEVLPENFNKEEIVEPFQGDNSFDGSFNLGIDVDVNGKINQRHTVDGTITHNHNHSGSVTFDQNVAQPYPGYLAREMYGAPRPSRAVHIRNGVEHVMGDQYAMMLKYGNAMLPSMDEHGQYEYDDANRQVYHFDLDTNIQSPARVPDRSAEGNAINVAAIVKAVIDELKKSGALASASTPNHAPAETPSAPKVETPEQIEARFNNDKARAISDLEAMKKVSGNGKVKDCRLNDSINGAISRMNSDNFRTRVRAGGDFDEAVEQIIKEQKSNKLMKAWGGR